VLTATAMTRNLGGLAKEFGICRKLWLFSA
jgi:hypothetical protein